MSELAASSQVDPESERRQLILDSALDAIVSIDAQGIIRDWNHRAEVMFGWTAEETLGRPLTSFIIPERFRSAHDRGLAHFLRTGEGPILNQRMNIAALRRNGDEFPIELTVSPAHIRGEWIFASFIRDRTEQNAAESRLSLQSDVARLLAEAASTRDAVAKFLEVIRRHTPWESAGFWQMGRAERAGSSDAAEESLSLVDMYVPDEPAFLSLRDASRTMRLAPGEGLPGRVMAAGRPQWFRYPGDLHLLIRRPEAEATGLRIGLALPVFIGDKAVGVLEFFTRRLLEPHPELEAVLLAVGRQLGQMLERRRAEEELRNREELLRLV
ncbi:MAG TPA: PAS domain S-box protein, partial [Fibrobacteria bacterium]|nr:PAS domain S-box protein [Fibrobacteria bacterium]